MLSDEEKKAINDLNFIIVTDIYDNEVSIDKTKIIKEYNESVGIVLNLIEKQFKEIEELKEKFSETYEYFKRDFTPNDEIKAKIEELNKEFKEYENGQEWEIQDEIRGQIDVLQSLLEKE